MVYRFPKTMARASFASRARASRYYLKNRIKKIERKIGQEELKCSIYSNYNATDGVSVPLIGGAAIKRIPNVAQGDNVLDRQGNKIIARKLQYRLMLQNADALSQACRLVMFYWNSDTAPTVTDVVNTPAAGAGVPNSPLQTINEISVANNHLKVFYDKTFFLTANASGNGASTRVVKINKKLARPVYFNDTAAGNMTRGYYYLLWGTDIDISAQDGINFYFKE